MKKIGISSCYFKNNYGSALQAFATQYFLDANNVPNETISIDDNKDFSRGKRKYYLSQVFNYSFIKAKMGMIKFVADKKLKKKLAENVSIRNKKFKDFRQEFNLSRDFVSYEEMSDYCASNYTAVVVGSDQLWLPVNVVADYYTLNWVPNGVKRISYSTSFGVASIPNKYKKLYRRFLNRFDFLSVREKSGQRIVEHNSDKKAALVCDPTILLTKKEWDDISGTAPVIDGKYILCYFLGNNIKHRKFAEKLKNETGCKIVSLNHADEYVKYSDKYCDIAPYDIGPKEWINLIKNAEYVCTDSFHGTVFSILFNKKFFDFRRHNAKNKNSTNSRIDSLLEIAGISKKRILSGDEEDIDKLLSMKINWTCVNSKIKEYRNNSSVWLMDSIKSGNENVKK